MKTKGSSGALAARPATGGGKKRPQPPRPQTQPKTWWYWAGALLALFLTFEIYRPALNGPFLFDDLYLPFAVPGFPERPLRDWLAGVRPMLMLSFWFSHRTSGLNPWGYHALNVILHFAASLLVVAITRRLLHWAGEGEGWKRTWLPLFAGAVFLVHPLQTESVAYIASRSEALSVMLAYASLAVFVGRPTPAVSWPRAGAILLLFGAATLTKEHAAVMPAAFLLTDLFWNPPVAQGGSWRDRWLGLRGNWRLYAPTLLAGASGLAFVWRVLRASDTAGFGMKDLTWYQYFFTQCRSLWVYARLYVLPFGQNLDYDFPVSSSVLEHGAIFGLAGLAAVVTAAIYFRRRYPLACYGVLLFLILIAPTSSVVPIRDTLVERRLYLPFLGLLLATVEALRRWRVSAAGMTATGLALVLTLSVLTWKRNHVWGGAVALWEDSVAGSPNKARPHFQLAYAYVQAGQCGSALRHYERVAALQPSDYQLLVDWALALDCAGRPSDAVSKLEQAAALERSAHVYSQIGMVLAKMGRYDEALQALETSSSIDPNYDMTYAYRGNIYTAQMRFDRAGAEYERALRINSNNQIAQEGMRNLARQLRRPR